MKVMDVLRAKLVSGTKLKTPVMGKEFRVGNVSATSVKLILGEGWETPIPAGCWNGIPAFLKGREWVEIGAVHGPSKPSTLESYIDRSVSRSAGNYVASVLEYVGIVEIDRRRPSKVRLLRSDLE